MYFVFIGTSEFGDIPTPIGPFNSYDGAGEWLGERGYHQPAAVSGGLWLPEAREEGDGFKPAQIKKALSPAEVDP